MRTPKFACVLLLTGSLGIGCGLGARHPGGALPRAEVPQPVFDEAPQWVDLYWEAWRLVWQRVRVTADGRRRFIDEGASDSDMWIWDSAFMTHFCKYAPSVCPGLETLDMLYARLHEGEAVGERVEHPDNPPIFAWAEWAHYQMTGDKRRLRWLLEEKQYLQRHYAAFERMRRTSLWGYSWSGNPSGMDNTPRGRGVGGHAAILWFDAAAQQAQSAAIIARMAEEIGRFDLRDEYQLRRQSLSKLVNDLHWNAQDGTYYDVSNADLVTHAKVMTPAAYWPLLAGITSREQAAHLARWAEDPWGMGGSPPFPSVDRSDASFETDGRYWRGGVWLPMVYMGTRALFEAGYEDLSERLARSMIAHQHRTYVRVSPHTLWESYSPSEPKWATDSSGGRTRPDFAGWSALGPIALFIEQVLGFHTIDAARRIVRWRRTSTKRHGLRGLRFAGITTDILWDGARVHVKSTGAYVLEINGIRYAVWAGTQSLGTHAPLQSQPGRKEPARSFVEEKAKAGQETVWREQLVQHTTRRR